MEDVTGDGEQRERSGEGSAIVKWRRVTRVLVADPSTATQRAISACLTPRGFLVMSVLKLEEAARHIGSWKPGILMVEFDVQIENAVMILENLGRDQNRPKVVLMSADNTAWALRMVSEGRVDAVLPKPLSLPTMAIVIESLLARDEHAAQP